MEKEMTNSSLSEIEEAEPFIKNGQPPRAGFIYSRICMQNLLMGSFIIIAFLLGYVTRVVFGDAQPAESVLSGAPSGFRDYVFDDGLGQNTSSGERIHYSGQPGPEIDEAWQKLVGPTYIRISDEEAANLPYETAALHKGGGHIITLAAFHQIHCLNMIRMGLAPDYYKFSHNQTEKTLPHHFGHCINILRQVIECFGDLTPVTYQRTTWEGKIAYMPDVGSSVHQCKNWPQIYDWADKRSLYNEYEDLDLTIL